MRMPPSVEITLRRQKLGEQYAASRGAPQGIVGKPDEFIIEHAVFAQPARAYAHAPALHAVEPGLGAVFLIETADEPRGGGGEGKFLRLAAEGRPGL